MRWYRLLVVLCLFAIVAEAGWRLATKQSGPVGSAVFVVAFLAGLVVLAVHVRTIPAIERWKTAAGLRDPGLIARSALWFAVFVLLIAFSLPSHAPPTIAGITCVYDPEKGYHQDIHISLFDHGRQVAMPMAIGVANPKIAPYPSGPDKGGLYAGTDDCVYWMHTHDSSGIIHAEPQTAGQTFTLGQFFAIWGQPLSPTRAAAYSGTVRVFRSHIGDPHPNVVQVTGDPRTVVMGYRSHDEITVQVGPPWAPPPRYVWPAPGAAAIASPSGAEIVLAKGATIGARGAPAPRTSDALSRVRVVALALLLFGGLIASLEWRFTSMRREGSMGVASVAKPGTPFTSREGARAQVRFGVMWVAASVVCAIGAAIVFYHIPIGSAAFFEYAGRAILKGNVLYRDVWDNKLPSIYYINSLWQILFGSQWVLQWIAQLGVLLATILLFAIFARGERVRYWGPATLVVTVLLSMPPLQHFGYTEPYALPFVMASLVAAQRRAPIASGIFLCLAATFWIPSALTVIAILVYQREQRSRVRFLLGFAISALVYGALMLVVLGPSVVGSLIHDMRNYESMKSRADAGGLKGLALHLLTTLESTALLIPVVLAIGVIRKPTTRTERFALVWLACTLAGAFVNLNLFQHYFIPSAAPLVFAIAIFWDWASMSQARRIVLAVLVLALIVRLPNIAAGVRDGIASDNEEARTTAAVGRTLDPALPKQSRILVVGAWNGIYLSANRDASGRFANAFGLMLTSADEQQARRAQYLDDIRRADAVVVNVGSIGRFAALDDVLRSDFTPACVGSIPRIEIYLHRRLSALQPPCSSP